MYLLDAYFVWIVYVCISYHTSTSRVRSTRTPAGARCLLLSCCCAALIRNERVARAFARGDERAKAVSSRLRHRPAPPQPSSTVASAASEASRNQSHGDPNNPTGDGLSSEPARAVAGGIVHTAGNDKGLWQPNKRAVVFYWHFFWKSMEDSKKALCLFCKIPLSA